MSGLASNQASTRPRTEASVSSGRAGNLVRAVPPMVTYHMGGSSPGSAWPERVWPRLRAALICFPRYSRLSCSICLNLSWIGPPTIASTASVPNSGKRDVYAVAVRVNQGAEQTAGALLGVRLHSQLHRRRHQLIPGELINGVPIFRTKGIPQTAALVIGLQLRYF